MTKYKYLSMCGDYNWIRNNYSDETLEEFEKTIAAYEEDETPSDGTEKIYKDFMQEGYKPIINWYEGLITTEDLLEIVEPDLIPLF